MELTRKRACCRCSAPVAGSKCANCAHWEREPDGVVVMGAFAGVLQQAIHGIKFGGLRHMGHGLGRRMGQMPLVQSRLLQADWVVPLPLHPARKRERGFNQSLYIARGLAEVLGKPLVDDVLYRRWSAPPQARLRAGQRRRNLDGGFALISRRSLPKTIALVDDVVSTGTTLAAGTRALKKGGAHRVLGAVLACPFIGAGID